MTKAVKKKKKVIVKPKTNRSVKTTVKSRSTRTTRKVVKAVTPPTKRQQIDNAINIAKMTEEQQVAALSNVFGNTSPFNAVVKSKGPTDPYAGSVVVGKRK